MIQKPIIQKLDYKCYECGTIPVPNILNIPNSSYKTNCWNSCKCKSTSLLIDENCQVMEYYIMLNSFIIFNKGYFAGVDFNNQTLLYSSIGYLEAKISCFIPYDNDISAMYNKFVKLKAFS